MTRSHTAANITVRALPGQPAQPQSSCRCARLRRPDLLRRPSLARWVLNTIAYAHLIPVIDGGILARATPDGRPLHIDWRIHTVGPGRACLLCLGALLRSDAALDKDGLLDDPDYLRGLSAEDRERYSPPQCLPLQPVRRSTRGTPPRRHDRRKPASRRIGPQHYAAFPGEMTAAPTTRCQSDCEMAALTATAAPGLMAWTCWPAEARSYALLLPARHR